MKNSVCQQKKHGINVTVEELVKLRFLATGLKLPHQKNVTSARSGNRISKLRGRGLEVTDIREYEPGDDIRYIDWRVMARTGEPHTKIYQEERERQVLFVVDYNASMNFGTRVAFKHVIAARIAALLAWAATQGNDRVGGVVYSAEKRIEVPPKLGKAGTLRLLKALADVPVSESSEEIGSLSETLLRVRTRMKPRGIIFIISDFYNFDEVAYQQLVSLRKHNDVVAVAVADVLELEPPKPNRYNISDGVNVTQIDTSSKRLRNAYLDDFQGHIKNVHDILRQMKIPYWLIKTDDDLLAALRGYIA